MANFCAQCGAAVEPDYLYCSSCGSPIVEATIPGTQKPAVEEPRSAEVPVAPVFTVGGSSQNQGAQQASSSEQPQQPQNVGAVGKSPVSRAWNDLKVQKDLVRQVVLLTIIMFIPIANFVTAGYVTKWGMGAAYGRRDALPRTIFGNGTFMMGFLILVLTLVWGLVLGLVSGIPLVGVVAGIFAAPMMQLCILRLAMYGTLGAGFELSKVWAVYKKSFGDALLAFWLPSLVATLAVGAVGAVASGTGLISGVGLACGTGVLSDSLSLAGLLITVILSLVAFAVAVASELLVARSMGYYLKDNAPEWAREAMVVNPQATQI